MSYFSKQWCEIHNEVKTNTFDIDQIVENMNRHTYHNATCDGIGFSKIYKDSYGRVWLGFKKQDGGYIWKLYNTVIASYKYPLNESSNIQRYS